MRVAVVVMVARWGRLTVVYFVLCVCARRIDAFYVEQWRFDKLRFKMIMFAYTAVSYCSTFFF